MKAIFLRYLLVLTVLAAACQKKSGEPLPPGQDEKALEQDLPAEPAPGEVEAEASEEAAATDEAVEAPETEPSSPQRQTQDYLDGRIASTQILRVYADGFFSLPAQKRLLAYRLSRAVFSGRPILMDQLCSSNLELTRFFTLLKKNNFDTPAQLDREFSMLLGQIWLNSGIYDLHTLRKLKPSFTAEQLQAAATALASTGVDLATAGKDESLEQKISRINQILFDPEFQPTLVYRPGESSTIFSHPLNLYDGITPRHLRSFTEKYPLNSRLVAVDEKVFEDVYRTGDRLRKISRGRYQKRLQQIIDQLERAAVLSGKELRRALVELAEFFRTGEYEQLQLSCQLLADSPEEVMFSLGFVDTSLDPRRKKGLLEGFVAIRNGGLEVQLASALSRLADIRELIDWPAEWKERTATPATAAELLAGIGRAGPVSGFSLWVCGGMSRKGPVVVFTNLLQAYSQAVWSRLAKSWPVLFGEKEELDFFKMAFTWEIFYSVVGPQLGARPEGFQERLFPFDQLALELFRAAAAFWLAGTPAACEIVMTNLQGQPDLLPRLVLLDWLHRQALSQKELPVTPQLQAQRMMINFFLDKKLLEVATAGAEIKINIAAASALAEQSGKLLRRLQRAIYLSDRTALKKMVEKYSGFDHRWVPTLAASTQAAGLMPRWGWLLPRLKLVKNEGRASDAAIDYDENLEQQIMRHLGVIR
jgi:hypothetical protein